MNVGVTRLLTSAGRLLSRVFSPNTASRPLRDKLHNQYSESLPEIKNDLASKRRARNSGLSGFQKRMRRHWRIPLELLDSHIVFAQVIAEHHRRWVQCNQERQNLEKLNVMTRLHARGCQAAGAIWSLLNSGFADDAFARWRSLYELSVVAIFIADSEDTVACQYRMHHGIALYRALLAAKRSAQALGITLEDSPEFERIEADRAELISRFGKNFKGDYGWASAALNVKNPRFIDIETAVGAEDMRPHYKWANSSVHAGALGDYNRIGLAPSQTHVALAGPSNLGLAQPGDLTAVCLAELTSALVGNAANPETRKKLEALFELANEIGKEFEFAEARLWELGPGYTVGQVE